MDFKTEMGLKWMDGDGWEHLLKIRKREGEVSEFRTDL
jgi:hypothetical protein